MVKNKTAKNITVDSTINTGGLMTEKTGLFIISWRDNID